MQGLGTRELEIQRRNITVLGLFGEMGRQSGKQRDVLLSPDTTPWRMSILPGQHNLLAEVCFQGLEEIDVANKITLWQEKCFAGQKCCLKGMVWFIKV